MTDPTRWGLAMLGGPVFEFELLKTARRREYYVVRVGYALVLLLILWQIHNAWESLFGQMLTHRLMSQFAYSTFAALAVWQEVLVLVLTPSLVAGVIASERQSKTLHYLMASPLSGLEVVLGKLLSRMLQVAIFLTVGFPILSMLVVLGGVDPRLVVLGCAAAGSTAFFLAGLSVLASVYARRVREALFLTYALELLWLVAPELVNRIVSRGLVPPSVADAIAPILEWVEAASPYTVAIHFMFAVFKGGGPILEDLLWMAGLQFMAGAVFVSVAAWRLRPAYRRQEGGAIRRSRVVDRLRRRLSPRPACGDRPMDWKERYTSRVSLLSRAVGVLLFLTVGGLLIYWTLYFGIPAFQELRTNGYGSGVVFGSAHHRTIFYRFLSWAAVPQLSMIGLLGVAASAAASVSSEHEDDTWVSLTATDLSAREIVLAKMTGAVWRVRWIWVGVGVLTLLGVVCGAVHPLGMVFEALALAIFAGFAAALGVFLSLNLRSTWRAQFLTIALLSLISISGQAILQALYVYAPFVWPGFMPAEISRVLLPLGFFQNLWPPNGVLSLRSFSPANVEHTEFWSLVFGVSSMSVYGLLAGLTTWATLKRFDRVAGRPRRGRHLKPRASDASSALTIPNPSAAQHSDRPATEVLS